MTFFRRQDVMQGPALVRLTLPSGTFDALRGAHTIDRRFADPETEQTDYIRVRLWKYDLPSAPLYGQTATLAGNTYRIRMVREWLDFYVLELEALYARA